jgi:hypothetical protein
MIIYRQLKKATQTQEGTKMKKAEIMRRAWELAKVGQANYGGSVKMYFSEALRIAWKESKMVKETKEEMIQRLEGLGFKRWTKGNMDRMYVNATMLGFTYDTNRYGKLQRSYFNGEEVGNCEGRKYLAAKTYLDLNTMEMISDRGDLRQAALELAKIA